MQMEVVKRYKILEIALLAVLFMGLLLLQQPDENWAGASAAHESIINILDFIASEQPHK